VCSFNFPTSEQAVENCFSLSDSLSMFVSVLEVAGQPDHVEPFFLKIEAISLQNLCSFCVLKADNLLLTKEQNIVSVKYLLLL
jgi:hypothetical protein